jgi:hypothetical protein
MRSTCYRHPSHWRERVELPHEVTTPDVAAPLSLALDGDAAVFPIVMTIVFSPEFSRRDAAYRHTWCA